MTLPDKTNPNSPRKRRKPQGRARSTNGSRRPVERTVHEDVEPVDRPLYRLEPDRKLQRHALQWVGLTFIAALTCVCVVAIAVGSVPTALVTAIAILALTIMTIVASVFPRSDGRPASRSKR